MLSVQTGSVVARSTSLYRGLLGSAWHQVDSTVRAAHLSGDRLRGRGEFKIANGKGAAARTLARMLRMPREAACARVELDVSRLAGGERWRRTFGDRRLETRQWAASDGLLAERVGCLEFRFELSVHEGAIHYRQRSVHLRCGALSLEVPRWIAPKVAAVEATAEGGAGSEVSVEVSMPPAGPLLSYRGRLEIES